MSSERIEIARGLIPIYCIEIEGLREKFSTEILDTDMLPLLVEPPTEISEKFNFEEGKTEIGQLSLKLLDKNNILTSLLATCRDSVDILKEDINKTQTIIKVGNANAFAASDVIYINRETMKVLSVDTVTNELTVERGIYGSYAWKHNAKTPIFKTLNFIRSRYIKLFEASRGADYSNEKRLIWTGLIDDMTLEPNTNIFSLECKSTTTLVHRKILEKQYEGYLATDMLGADDEHALELKYADITIRPIEDYNWLPADSYVYVKIDDEIIEAKRFSTTHTFKVLRRGDDWGEGHPLFSEWKAHALFATCRFLFPTSQELETFFKFDGVKSDHYPKRNFNSTYGCLIYK